MTAPDSTPLKVLLLGDVQNLKQVERRVLNIVAIRVGGHYY